LTVADQEQGATPESEVPTGLFKADASSVAETQALIGRAMMAAEPNAVFGAPIEQGAYTLITCSEVGGGLGAGFGGGADETGSTGSGGGGGGGSFGRPVAVIVVGPNGVEVEPVFDMTKVGIAALAALGALFMSWGRMSGR
jgi:uncharacterized spore protein YtfJ